MISISVCLFDRWHADGCKILQLDNLESNHIQKFSLTGNDGQFQLLIHSCHQVLQEDAHQGLVGHSIGVLRGMADLNGDIVRQEKGFMHHVLELTHIGFPVFAGVRGQHAEL